MGVPYFYTWITRRYPLFKKLYDPEIMPSIDNLFIDLNGVLYKCSRDDKALYRDILRGKSFDEIFSAIYNYINFLVNHIRPRKRIYIAIDGVAPRAKMNNQRQRRYHSARSNKSLNEFLTNDLKTDAGILSFKNNSITPGTEFMMDLIENVKFFVMRKIHEDENWKGIEVLVTGGDVPGEGEHKIMDWLRGWKQSPDFNINESHCIYSNDADLVFLSLSLHLPKVLILREAMKFTDNNVNSATKRHTEDQKMEILFINLLREYFELEYTMDKNLYTKHQFDIERIIDDFILVAFFIGNDFLHQLYCMSTKKGNFDEIIDTFKKSIPEIGGYLSDRGIINWGNFSKFLNKVAKLENKMIKTTLDQMEDYIFEIKKSKKSLFVTEEEWRQEEEPEEHYPDKVEHPKAQKPETDFEEEDNPDIELDEEKKKRVDEDMVEVEDDEENEEKFYDAGDEADKELRKVDKAHELEHQLAYKKILSESQYIRELLSVFEKGSEDEKKKKRMGFYQKFFDLKDLSQVEGVCNDYIKGLQFVMYYYFHGCPSWSWYYPYFMSPFLTDLVQIVDSKLPNIEIQFNRDAPYHPFDQLAYIQPKSSLGLLPPVYAEVLLKDPRTIKYFPDSFDFEPFDAVQDFKWIAKLDIFNDKEMQEVLKSIDKSKFNATEIKRNSRGTEYIYKYNKNVVPINVKSIHKDIPSFDERIEVIDFNVDRTYPFDPAKLHYQVKGVNENDGFPSLKILPGVSARMERKDKSAKYSKLVIVIDPDNKNSQAPKRGFKGWVFYDYPFKKMGYINTEITTEGQFQIGHVTPKVIESIVSKARARSTYEGYGAVANDSSRQLYFDKGIDYIGRDKRESFYELEHRKSAWRTVMDPKCKIVYEFDNVDEIYPHGMLIQFSKDIKNKMETQFTFPISEEDIFKQGLQGVNLFNGDIFNIKKSDSEQTILVDVVKPNPYSSKATAEAKLLVESNWKLITDSTLKELGLQSGEALILYGLMDSLVIKTDTNKTSSIILGGMFDIGLRLIKALEQMESRVMTVTDFVK